MSIEMIGLGSYLPKKIVKNEELEKKFNLDPGWIFKRTGIKERRILDQENYINACTMAANKAIEQANIDAQHIELIINASVTPYQLMPSSAVLIQNELQIKKSISFDIQAACSGFIYALILAESFMRANNLTYALVLGCDAFSKIIDTNDYRTGVLFGDGFGAVVLKNNKQSLKKGIFYTHYGTDLSGINDLKIAWGVAQGFDALTQTSPYVTMNGQEVFKSAVQRFSDEINRAMYQQSLVISDIGHIITHQANSRIISAVCQNLNIPIELCAVSLTSHGNTSAASIPLALDDLYQNKAVKEGQILLLTAFGAGYTWGTVLIEV